MACSTLARGAVMQLGGVIVAQVANPIQVQKYLKGVDYPCSKRDLVEKARSEGADQTVLSTLEQIADRTYNGPSAVAEEIGKLK